MNEVQRFKLAQELLSEIDKLNKRLLVTPGDFAGNVKALVSFSGGSSNFLEFYYDDLGGKDKAITIITAIVKSYNEHILNRVQVLTNEFKYVMNNGE